MYLKNNNSKHFDQGKKIAIKIYFLNINMPICELWVLNIFNYFLTNQKGLQFSLNPSRNQPFCHLVRAPSDLFLFEISLRYAY